MTSTANSIPASQLVSVQPEVIGTGGSPLALNAVFLTQNASVQLGAVLSFATLATVSAFFGAGAAETLLAAVYFLGFDNSNIKPGNLFFAQYAATAVPAYVRGGSMAAVTLAQLKLLSGTIICTINGVLKTSGTINLSSATSFSNAAALIQTGLAAADASVTASISTTNMTVSAIIAGALYPGQVLSGTGVTAGTTIVSQTSGTTGGTGVYVVSISQTTSSTTITGGAALVTFNAQLQAFQITGGTPGAVGTISFASGTLAAGINLTSATGAVLSQGSDATTPVLTMNAVAALTQNWATFMTVWEPDLATKQLFEAWTNAQNARYAYVAWDSDVNATQSGNTANFGYLVNASNSVGAIPVYPVADKAAFICGAVASLDFNETNGRATLAYKGQSGLVADVTDTATAANLIANGYNFYGAYATANDRFVMLQPGQTSGAWKWIDTYVNQIYLNSQFQLALMSLLTQIKSLPYNNEGYALMREALMDPINQALNFGALRAGVPLSAAQAAEVNNAAGVKIDGTLSTQGWYLQILDATAQVRGARGTPPCTFWYMDGGSIQKVNLASVAVQ
jgi:hypothetical protein